MLSNKKKPCDPHQRQLCPLGWLWLLLLASCWACSLLLAYSAARPCHRPIGLGGIKCLPATTVRWYLRRSRLTSRRGRPCWQSCPRSLPSISIGPCLLLRHPPVHTRSCAARRPKGVRPKVSPGTAAGRGSSSCRRWGLGGGGRLAKCIPPAGKGRLLLGRRLPIGTAWGLV